MGRTLVVGDVHGCAAELEELLDRAAYAEGDRLVFVGDLIARGPDTRRVLQIVRDTGARAVLGNHEEHLLAARAGHREPAKSHRALVHELDERDWQDLETLPRFLDLPEHDLRVVHAGVVPGVPIEAQDPWALTHMRSLDAHGQPSSKRAQPLWASLYTGSPHIVFGHDAMTGLQLEASATGLDTACVYGGRLSALVLAPAERVPPAKDRAALIVSVAARRAYYSPS